MDRAYRHLIAIQSVLALANATAGIFTIVFFLKRGFAIESVVLFSLISFLVATLTCIALVRTRPRMGGALMIVGLAILSSSYVAYLVADGWPLLLYVGIAWGLYIPLFFVPFNVLIIGTTRAEDRAGKIGSFILAYTAVAILAPTLGGTIIESAGYAVVFSFAAVVLVGNVALVARLRVGRDSLPISFDLSHLGRRTAAALLAQGGFEGLAFGVVPLLVYGFTQDELGIGGLFSLFALAGGAVTVLLGVASDRLRARRPFLLAGASATAAATTLVVVASSLPAFALANSLVSLTAPIVTLFLFTMAVERIPTRPADAIVTREILLNGGRTASLAAFLTLLAVGLAPRHGYALAGACMAVVALARPWRSSPERLPRASV